MKIFHNSKDLKIFIEEQKNKNLSIGFAPTMGALHQGHLSLYEKARKENDVVIGSIFVNPTQFNNTEDLKKYPRTPKKDIDLLKQSQFVDVVYLPEIQDIYPKKVISKNYNFHGLENQMEGKFRPGHFNGVGTVVEVLFRQICPDRAYFGEKDFQQFLIIQKLVEILNLPIEIIQCPILREENGLAMSSRNQRLSPTARKNAQIIYQSLTKAKDLFKNKKTSLEIKTEIKLFFEKNPLFELEYFTIADEEKLEEVSDFKNDIQYRAFIAVFTENVRLVDTIQL